MRLVIGLGNVGANYERTRHNAGFMALDHFLKAQGLKLDEKKFGGEFLRTKEVIYAKPHTLMNASGSFVGQLVRFFKVEIKNVLIVYDDISHPLGVVAMKPRGSSAGHNGVQDIIEHLGTNDFARLKIGIGAPATNLVDHVLSNFKPSELAHLKAALDKTSQVIAIFINDGPEKAMQWANTKGEQPA